MRRMMVVLVAGLVKAVDRDVDVIFCLLTDPHLSLTKWEVQQKANLGKSRQCRVPLICIKAGKVYFLI